MTARIPLHRQSIDNSGKKTGGDSLQRYQAEFCLNTVAPQKHTVFQIDQSSLRPTTEKRSHWSIAWSDLMMTMFILFLSLFVYQAAHKDLLVSNKQEIVAGDIQETLEVAKNPKSAFPFVVIKPAAPLVTAGTVKKVESITLEEVDLQSAFSPVEVEKTLEELAGEIPQIASKNIEPIKKDTTNKETYAAITSEPVIQPLPLNVPEIKQPEEKHASVNSLFDQSQVTLDAFNLNEFAAIDLVPDQAIRIILTGDLLFETGDAALSIDAVYSLEKIAEVINTSPYQIHIEGHTDNVPIHSGRYSNNWELSFARANAVATFLIEDMGMDPHQFVISGYASYRPIAPNTSPENRASNRRVEIVIAQKPLQTEDTPLASIF